MSNDVHAADASDGSAEHRFNGELDFTLRLCEMVGSSFSLKAAILLRNGDIPGYLELSCDPSCYEDPKRFAEDYLVAEVLRKSKNLPIQQDLESEARAKFLSAEQRNRETNDRLWMEPLPSWWGDYSRELLTVLGPCDTEVLQEIAELSKHGPGASVGVRGDGIVPSDKYDNIPSCTESLEPLLYSIMPEIVSDYWTSGPGKKKVVRGSRYFTVTKHARARRSCAKEPTWNVFIQAGTGRKIRQRLKRFGVDLRDQKRNQYLASLAFQNEGATIDLSQASDMNAKNAVFLALCYNRDPHGLRWWHLLNLVRSPEIDISPLGAKSPEWKQLEMMSSMGNGYTFPLESAIFYAVVRSVVPEDRLSECSVYGDDIIVPQMYSEVVIERLEFIGFMVNRSKTCLAGKFFESCGTDWFKGHNVRPFYLSSDGESQVPWALSAANALRAWLMRVYGYCDLRWVWLWDALCLLIPRPWNNPVPPGLGDVGIHVGFSENEWCRPANDDTFSLDRKNPPPGLTWEGVVVKHVVVIPVTKDKKTFGVMAAGLSAIRGVPLPRGPNVREKHHQQWWARTRAQWAGFIPPASATYGLEPMRGYLRAPRTIKNVVLPWGDGISWM